MNFKKGDKVQVKSNQWFNNNSFGEGLVTCGNEVFVADMVMFCGEIVTIDRVVDDTYLIEEDNHEWFWNDLMFEEKQ